MLLMKVVIYTRPAQWCIGLVHYQLYCVGYIFICVYDGVRISSQVLESRPGSELDWPHSDNIENLQKQYTSNFSMQIIGLGTFTCPLVADIGHEFGVLHMQH